MPTPIRVLVAHNLSLVRMALRSILGSEHGVIIEGEASDAYETQRMCRELQADVLLLGLDLSSPLFCETVTFLQVHCPETKVVVMANGEDATSAPDMVALGVNGYVCNDMAPETLVMVVQIVGQGGMCFSQAAAQEIRAWVSRKLGATAARTLLTEREVEVLRLLAKGNTNLRIAELLSVSERTVRFHLRNVYDKLDVRTRAEALAWAVRAGLDVE